jgi:hypothetical protein
MVPLSALRLPSTRIAMTTMAVTPGLPSFLPLTWKYLTDDQIRAIRAKIQMAMPPERYSEWIKWMVSSLNVNELMN